MRELSLWLDVATGGFPFSFLHGRKSGNRWATPRCTGANSKSGDETPEVLTTRLLFNSATEVDDVWVAGLT